MRSLTILIALILLTACKQFTLSEEDKKILAESDLLMSKIQETQQSHIFKIIHSMNSNVQITGNRPDDTEVLNHTMNAWNRYKHLCRRIEKSTKKISEDSIYAFSIYDGELSIYGEELKYKISQPIQESTYFSNNQLKLGLTGNLETLIDDLKLRVGGFHGFNIPQLICVKSKDKIQFYLYTSDQGFMLDHIIIPTTLTDSLLIQQLPSWTKVNYSDQEIISVSLFSENGKTYYKDFREVSQIQTFN